MPVVVYTASKCMQCVATKRLLGREGIDYVEVDVDNSPQARDFLFALGYAQVPVVVAGPLHWAGFRPERIKALRFVDV